MWVQKALLFLNSLIFNLMHKMAFKSSTGHCLKASTFLTKTGIFSTFPQLFVKPIMVVAIGEICAIAAGCSWKIRHLNGYFDGHL